MKKLLFLLLGMIAFYFNAYAQYSGTVVDQSRNPVADVKITFIGNSNDTVAKLISDKEGKFEYSDSVRFILFSHPGFDPAKADVRNDKDRLFFMHKSKDLAEIVVTPKLVQQFEDHDSYYIPRKAMKKYINTLHSLNEIPLMNVSPQGEVSYEGEGVRFLLNGVQASASEIAAISKDDVYKVNVYRTPPQQLLGADFTTVVEITLKSDLRGGNGSIRTNNAVNKIWGDNNAAFYYNYKTSRFSLLYDNTYRHHHKGGYNDETMSYEFDGVEYNKTKHGEPGRTHNDENSLKVAFQNGRTRDYQFDAIATLAFARNSQRYIQNVTTSSGAAYNATSLSRSPMTNFGINLNFQKHLGEKGKYGRFIAGARYGYNHSKYFDSYVEENADVSQEPAFFALTDIKSRLNSFWAMASYSTPTKKWGSLAVNIQDSHREYRELNNDPEFKNRQNWLNIFARYNKRYGKFYWTLTAGITNSNIHSEASKKSENKLSPIVMASTTFYAAKTVRLSFSYRYGTDGPSMSQMTETPQWRDNYYVYHGNSALGTFSSHDFNLRGSYYNDYIQLSISANYNHAPDAIGTMFLTTSDYILETLVNQKRYRKFNSSGSLRLYPLGKKIWDISANVAWGRIWGENSSYSYKGDNTNYNFSTSVNKEHWNAGVNIQLESKKFSGTTTTTRPLVWGLYGLYRPIENLSVGIFWYSPFTKYAKTKEYSVKEALVHFNSVNFSPGLVNRLSVSISYYFNFGKRHNKYSDIEAGEIESGILRR